MCYCASVNRDSDEICCSLTFGLEVGKDHKLNPVSSPGPGDDPKLTQDAAVQVSPPSPSPSPTLANDSCKLRAELAQKDMDIIGLSLLAVIMIIVIGEPE